MPHASCSVGRMRAMEQAAVPRGSRGDRARADGALEQSRLSGRPETSVVIIGRSNPTLRERPRPFELGFQGDPWLRRMVQE
jgi:hypothetical protein